MTHRRALLIGIDTDTDTPSLSGALNDVTALGEALLNAGFDPSQITVLTHPALPAHRLPGIQRGTASTQTIQQLSAQVADETHADGTTWVHVSSRGRHAADGPVVLTADGEQKVAGEGARQTTERRRHSPRMSPWAPTSVSTKADLL